MIVLAITDTATGDLKREVTCHEDQADVQIGEGESGTIISEPLDPEKLWRLQDGNFIERSE